MTVGRVYGSRLTSNDPEFREMEISAKKWMSYLLGAATALAAGLLVSLSVVDAIHHPVTHRVLLVVFIFSYNAANNWVSTLSFMSFSKLSPLQRAPTHKIPKTLGH